MNKFKQMDGLENKVGIIVPSTTNVNVKMNTSDIVDFTLGTLTDMFGGATAVKQTGGWNTGLGELVKEESTMVYAYAETLTDSELDKIHRYAEKMAGYLSQEAVAVEVNNTLYFVEPVEEK